MVVEELVEGGSTRLASFFYSQIPANAGPVRSMRASDIGIVKPVNGQMVTSGAAGVTIGRLKGAGVKFYSEGATGFFREGSRSAPYNLMVKLDELAGSVKVDEARPDDYLPWGERQGPPEGPGRHRARRVVLRRPHHQLDVPRREVPQRQHLRRRGRPVRRRQRAGAAGPGRRRRLPRPGRQPGPRDEVRRQGPGDAVPRRSPGARHLVEGQAGRPAQADHQGRRADRPGRSHLDRAGAERLTAAGVTFGK